VAKCEGRWKVDPSGAPEDGWPGFDFDTYLELCRCCGIEPLKSGSRWSPFFCDACKERVIAFNRACGRWVIPIGRHSMMHGVLLAADVDLEEAKWFVSQAKGLFAGSDHLNVRARACVRENVEGLGFPAGEEVELHRYVAATSGRRESRRPRARPPTRRLP
jgi:hypothetical protein